MNSGENVNGVKNKKIERKLKDIPEIYREIYEKAVLGGSKPAAIKAFCLECACWEKNEIIKCNSVACPLYMVRPFVKRQGILERALEILRRGLTLFI